MKKYRIWICIYLYLVLTACATPKGKGPLFKYVSPPEGQATVYHYRPTSFVGHGQDLLLYMNGTLLTKIENGGYYKHILAPGNYQYVIKRQIGHSIINIKERKSVFNITVEPGHSYFFRWNTSLSKAEHLEIVFKNTGLKELAVLREFGGKSTKAVTWTNPPAEKAAHRQRLYIAGKIVSVSGENVVVEMIDGENKTFRIHETVTLLDDKKHNIPITDFNAGDDVALEVVSATGELLMLKKGSTIDIKSLFPDL